MARAKTDFFLINGNPVLTPDADVGFNYTDLDASDSGRDESGYMRRIVVRHKVGSWAFVYSSLTEEEKQYMESLFPDTETFEFTHPDRLDASKSVTTTCYRSNCDLSWFNAKSGLWRNYKFNIIEC